MTRFSLLGLVVACIPPGANTVPTRSAFGEALAANLSLTMADLRHHDPHCAGVVVPGDRLQSIVQACPVRGAPGTLEDSDTPYVYSRFDGETFGLADPGNWQLTVTDPGGAVIAQKVLDHEVANVGRCTADGCRKWGTAVVQLPAAWRPGTYAFRYVCAFDTRLVADMTITLR